MALDPILERLEAGRLKVLVEDRGELVLASDRPGLAALRDTFVDHPELLDGADVALPTVGLAPAYLLIASKVGRVFARAMTQEARRALEEEGIEHAAGELVKKLTVAEYDVTLDDQARAAVTPHAFAEELRRTR